MTFRPKGTKQQPPPHACNWHKKLRHALLCRRSKEAALASCRALWRRMSRGIDLRSWQAQVGNMMHHSVWYRAGHAQPRCMVQRPCSACRQRKSEGRGRKCDRGRHNHSTAVAPASIKGGMVEVGVTTAQGAAPCAVFTLAGTIEAGRHNCSTAHCSHGLAHAGLDQTRRWSEAAAQQGKG